MTEKGYAVSRLLADGESMAETFGQMLARLRSEESLSLRTLGRRAAYSYAVISQVENGRRPPTRQFAEAMDRALDAGGELVRLAAAGGAGQPRDEDERLAYALAHPNRVDRMTAIRLREHVQNADARYETMPSTSLLADTGRYLAQLSYLTKHARNTDVRMDLLVAEAEAAILMGQLVWDASQRRDHATTRTHLAMAERAAQAAGDRKTESLALLRSSIVALYGEDDPRNGIPVATRSAEAANGYSNVLFGLAQLHVAEGHAILGEQRQCEAALAEADRSFTQVDPADVAAELYSPSQLGRLAGSCYLRLGSPERAQVALERAGQLLSEHSKSSAIVFGNLALSSIRQQQPDEACAALHRALDVVGTTWGGGGLNVVFAAIGELRPWRTLPAVQQVTDRVIDLMQQSSLGRSS